MYEFDGVVPTHPYLQRSQMPQALKAGLINLRLKTITPEIINTLQGLMEEKV